MKHREVGIGDLDTEVRQEAAALGQGKNTGRCRGSHAAGRTAAAGAAVAGGQSGSGQHQLDGIGRPALDKFGHVDS